MSNPYRYPVTCNVCGGEAMGTVEALSAQWFGAVRHANPEACARNLEERARRLAERERALTERSKS